MLYGISLVVFRFSLGQFDPRAFVSLRIMLASAAAPLTGALIVDAPIKRATGVVETPRATPARRSHSRSRTTSR